MFGRIRKKKRKKEVNQIQEFTKPYVQFSKRVIRFCILNLIAIEIFVMFMVFITKDTGVLPYLITSLAVQFLGCVVWYLKNSEAEKKVRIEAEIERMKLVSKTNVNDIMDKVRTHVNPEDTPDTFYKGNEGEMGVNTDILPTVSHVNNNQSYTDSDFEPVIIEDSNDTIPQEDDDSVG